MQLICLLVIMLRKSYNLENPSLLFGKVCTYNYICLINSYK